MRQRKVKDLDIKIENNRTYLIDEPTSFKGKWHELFNNDNPIHIEIGSGKGKFITSMAIANPDINYLAFEGQDDIALRILEKNEELRLDNLRVIISFVQDLNIFFNPGEIEGIYLNFSDPWRKGRHKKRRLTYRDRILNYLSIMDRGFIEFRTDNTDLFNFSLEELEFLNIKPEILSFDYNADITTEYEDKFKLLGKKINFFRINK